jgi:hypothetical protein
VNRVSICKFFIAAMTALAAAEFSACRSMPPAVAANETAAAAKHNDASEAAVAGAADAATADDNALAAASADAAHVAAAAAAATDAVIDVNASNEEKIIRTFAKVYPDLVRSVQFTNNDWTMLVNGKRFYYAHGRFLPEELKEQWEEYSAYDFYVYPWGGTEKQRIAAYLKPVYSIGSSFLYDALYSAGDEDESWAHIEKHSFLRVKLLVHSYIKNRLTRIESLIKAEAAQNKTVQDWIDELQTLPLSGWSWRNIAGTKRRSNHSYGTAIDLLPRELKGRSTYWKWDQKKGVSVPKNLYSPPLVVIKIFEDHGFIWGGKWDILDTMHFEYRPEILLLNGFSIMK